MQNVTRPGELSYVVLMAFMISHKLAYIKPNLFMRFHAKIFRNINIYYHKLNYELVTVQGQVYQLYQGLQRWRAPCQQWGRSFRIRGRGICQISVLRTKRPNVRNSYSVVGVLQPDGEKHFDHTPAAAVNDIESGLSKLTRP